MAVRLLVYQTWFYFGMLTTYLDMFWTVASIFPRSPGYCCVNISSYHWGATHQPDFRQGGSTSHSVGMLRPFRPAIQVWVRGFGFGSLKVFHPTMSCLRFCCWALSFIDSVSVLCSVYFFTVLFFPVTNGFYAREEWNFIKMWFFLVLIAFILWVYSHMTEFLLWL